MLGHLGINVDDLAAARNYYGSLMPLLGFETFLDAEDEFAYRPAAGKRGTYLFFYPSLSGSGAGSGPEAGFSRHNTGLQHLAFMVPTRSAVREVHRTVVELGGEVLHEPRSFPEYPPPYFACFWLDPFGIMLEAVCHHDRE